MFWVFCTSCFTRPSPEVKRKFFVTNCAHMICEQCFSSDNPMCRRCALPCKAVPCNAEMPNEIKELFHDVNDRSATFIKALEYQNSQRHKIMSFQKHATQKYRMAKTMLNDLNIKVSDLKNKNDCLEQKCFFLENHIEELNRKINWYSKKISSSQGSYYQSPFPQMAFQASPDNGNHLTSQLNQTFGRIEPTPIVPKGNRMKNFTPYSSNSGGSAHTPLLNFPSAHSSLVSKVHTFTPPSETIELLSQLNKSRRHY